MKRKLRITFIGSNGEKLEMIPDEIYERHVNITLTKYEAICLLIGRPRVLFVYTPSLYSVYVLSEGRTVCSWYNPRYLNV